MITQPLFIVSILFLIEVSVLELSRRPRFQKFFSFLPYVFWIYFLPMIVSSAGVISAKSPVYGAITDRFLPASLFLLLVGVDLKAIWRLGGPAMIMMLAGSAGIILGTAAVFALVKSWVGPQMWSGFGALSASWTGGSANMIAVKEAVKAPDDVFLPMVVVDTIVPYIWMGILVAAAGWQAVFDRRIRADRKILDDLSNKISASPRNPAAQNSKGWMSLGIIIIGFVAGQLAQGLARALPEIPGVVSTTAWMIIMASVLGMAVSLTPLRRLEKYGSSRIGYLLLYFVLTTIGAKADLSRFGSVGLLIGAGFLIVLIHAGILILTARLIRAPLFLVATASQANIGGVASAPMVAEIYQPGLASVGLLLAVWGNITGTYLGLITAQLCRWIASLS